MSDNYDRVVAELAPHICKARLHSEVPDYDVARAVIDILRSDWVFAVEALGGDAVISDGYHTFAELYRYRLLYNAALFNEWSRLGEFHVHKSWRHSDGEPCFGGGWFIVVAMLPTGQISNHYKAEHWDLFQVAEAVTPAEYDGHTPADVADRLEAFLKVKP